MLSSQEQMEIIKAALARGYKGPISELIEQAIIDRGSTMQRNPEMPQAPTPSLAGKIPGDQPMSSTERNIIKPGQYKDGGERKSQVKENGGPDEKTVYGTAGPEDVAIYGSPEYKQAYEEGKLVRMPKDPSSTVYGEASIPEVKITWDKKLDQNILKEYPYYHSLSKEQQRWFRDEGILGKGVRTSAKYAPGTYADSVTEFAKAMTVDPILTTVGVPQSMMVEGIEALRGNEANAFNALHHTTQRLPSDVWGFENKPGWDLGGSLNTAMNIFADPLVVGGITKAPTLIRSGLKSSTPSINTNLFRRSNLVSASDNPNIITQSAEDVIKGKAAMQTNLDALREGVKSGIDFKTRNFEHPLNQAKINRYPANQANSIKSTWARDKELGIKPYLSRESTTSLGESGRYRATSLGEQRIVSDPESLFSEFGGHGYLRQFPKDVQSTILDKSKKIIPIDQPIPRYSRLFEHNLLDPDKVIVNLTKPGGTPGDFFKQAKQTTVHEWGHSTDLPRWKSPRHFASPQGNIDLDYFGGRNQLGVVTQEGIINPLSIRGVENPISKWSINKTFKGKFDQPSAGEGFVIRDGKKIYAKDFGTVDMKSNIFTKLADKVFPDKRSRMLKRLAETPSSGKFKNFLEYIASPEEVLARVQGFKGSYNLDVADFHHINKNQAKELFDVLEVEDEMLWSIFKDADAFRKVFNKTHHKKGGFKYNDGGLRELTANAPIYDSQGVCWSNCGQRNYDPEHNLSLGMSMTGGKSGDDYTGSVKGTLGYDFNPSSGTGGLVSYLGANYGIRGTGDEENMEFKPEGSLIGSLGYKGEIGDTKSYRRRGNPLHWGAGAYVDKSITGGGTTVGGYGQLGNFNISAGYNPQSGSEFKLGLGIPIRKEGGFKDGEKRSKLISKIKGSRKGVQANPDGSESTHIMAYAGVDDKYHVYPTLFQDKKGVWYPGGYDEAKRKGEVYIFDTEEEAAEWAGPNAPWKTKKSGPGYKKGGLRKRKCKYGCW